MQTWTQFFNRPVPNMVLRVLVLLLGMALVAFGIALSRATDLGVSPISAVPNVLSFATPLTLGVWTFVLNIVFIAAQVALLRRDFNLLQLLSLPFIMVFSAMIDGFVPLCSAIPMDGYVLRMALILLSCAVIAVGVLAQAQAALILIPGDGIVVTLSHVLGVEFGRTKTCFDVSLIVAGAVLSFVLIGQLVGVREGSIIAAVLVGVIIRWLRKVLPDLELLVPTKGHRTFIPEKK